MIRILLLIAIITTTALAIGPAQARTANPSAERGPLSPAALKQKNLFPASSAFVPYSFTNIVCFPPGPGQQTFAVGAVSYASQLTAAGLRHVNDPALLFFADSIATDPMLVTVTVSPSNCD